MLQAREMALMYNIEELCLKECAPFKDLEAAITQEIQSLDKTIKGKIGTVLLFLKKNVVEYTREDNIL